MNSKQRSQGNKQSDQGANEKSSPSRSKVTADKGNLNPSPQSQQSGGPGGSQQQGGQSRGPVGSRQSAEQDMDEDTGLSNRANRQSSEADEGSRQAKQSNVGRRDDGTPD